MFNLWTDAIDEPRPYRLKNLGSSDSNASNITAPVGVVSLILTFNCKYERLERRFFSSGLAESFFTFRFFWVDIFTHLILRDVQL
ncbi:hypothetical protein THIOM_002183 [Candidatus Thiomargarita nelsonii]|uniref:Uncharacterized protein n=1 Tax=Candidatus Thiomargarita nelsonii TaxID=1003181 RepID=A0A176S1T5_9GAMM|nr:hypothetical protein THIOM_002183 [Candidatus Thiomargarita nelsonii]